MLFRSGTQGQEVDEATLVFNLDAVTNPTSLLTQPGREGEANYDSEQGQLQFDAEAVLDNTAHHTQPNPETDRY